MKSKFTGNLFGLMGIYIVSFALTVCTLGIGAPWAACMLTRWTTKHTVIDGQRLRFDGKGGDYFKLIVLCTLPLFAIFGLTFYTTYYVQDPSMAVLLMGAACVLSVLYVFWYTIRILKWSAKYTHFETTPVIVKEDIDEVAAEMNVDMN